MIRVCDVYCAADDGDKVHLSLCEGRHTLTLVCDYRAVVISANEEQSQAGSSRCIYIVRQDDTELTKIYR